MTPNAYTVRYASLLLFYICVNFILFIIVKNDDMKIFVPRINNTHFKNIKKFDPNSKRLTPSPFKDICLKHNISTPLKRMHFLYSVEQKLLYCWIRKVASTSFTKLFFNINKRSTRFHYKHMKVLAPNSQEKLEKVIMDDKIFKFIIVRHPLERLVSSYRDRIEDNSKYTDQSWIFARKIFHLTRPYLMKGNTTIGNPIHQIYDNQKRLKIVPTFSEFVTWLLHPKFSESDPHWVQFTDHCSLCEIKYDKILKLENNHINDIEDLFSKINSLNIKNSLSVSQKTIFGPTNFTLTCQYLNQLSKQQIIQLYKKYLIDFEIFNYDYKKYLKCASDYN